MKGDVVDLGELSLSSPEIVISQATARGGLGLIGLVHEEGVTLVITPRRDGKFLRWMLLVHG